MNNPITSNAALALLQKLSIDIDQMRALFCAIEDRAMDGGGGLAQGSAVAMHLETLARIGSDIAERNSEVAHHMMMSEGDHE